MSVALNAGVVALLLAFLLPPLSLAEDAPPTESPAPGQEAPKPRPELVPGKGFKLFTGDWGDLSFSLYTYVRYLNQDGLDPTYTNSVGTTKDLDLRDDIQLQKMILYFKGWFFTPQFRYLAYVWTANTSQGQGAQVVVAGNLNYTFNDYVALGAGIAALPTTRSTLGTFPFWLRQDARPIADEYFRGSYTTGIYAWGDLTKGLHYKAMIGNNLSQLGVDAAQLDAGVNTYSASLWWTTRNFGAYAGYGDFEDHEEFAATVGGAYTQSRETAQEQPGTDDPENTQIRVSDGRGVFDVDAFAPGTRIEEATYHMATAYAELKYRGFSLSGEYYYRLVDDLNVKGEISEREFRDRGFQSQASAMVIPRVLQLYLYGSKIDGQYGDPWDFGVGLNYFPFKTRALRLNAEATWVDNSPVGYLSYPLLVGANGTVYMVNLELNL
jgi:hypothetical protein